MTAAAKAVELFQRMFINMPLCADNTGRRYSAKLCAIIAVDELIDMANIYDNHNVKTDKHIYTFECVIFWKQVKEEINKL